MRSQPWWQRTFVWLMIPAFLYMLAFLLFPAFNIIDDGASLLVAEHLQNSPWSEWPNLLIEHQTGRLRPLYHLFAYGLYVMFGLRPFFFWLAQTLVLGLTLMGMAHFLYRETKKYWLAGLAPLVLLIFTPVAENYYRLGTVEPKQMLIWSWLLVWLSVVKEKGWSVGRFIIGTLLFGAAIFFKETSLIFAGMIGVLAVWDTLFNSKKALSAWLQTGLVIGLMVVFFLLLPEAQGYSSGFQLNINFMWQRLLAARLEYAAILFPLFLAMVATLVRFGYNFLIQKRIKWSNYFWVGLLLSQIILMLGVGILPWQYQLPRYFYPLYIMSILYIVIEASSWFSQPLPFAKVRIEQKLLLATILVFGIFLIQKLIFQSGVGLNLYLPSVWMKLLIFRLEAAPMLFLFLLGMGISCVRLAVLYLFKPNFKEIDSQEYIWQVWVVAMLVLMIPLSVGVWQHLWPRMLYTINLLIIIYYGLELILWQRIREQNWWKKVKVGPLLSLSTAMIVAVMMLNQRLLLGQGVNLKPFFGNTFQALQHSFDTHQISYALISDLIDHTPEDAHIFVSSDDYEIVFEIGLYASRLKQRHVTIYTNNQQLLDDVGSDFPYLTYVADPVEAFVASSSQPKILLLRKKTWQAFTNPTQENTLTPNLAKHVQTTNWSALNGQEMRPLAVFNVIPSEANWVIVK